MKTITKQSEQSDEKTAFTIIELLTVMSIIIILISLLVPSLQMVKRYAKEVRQKAQFHSIDSAMELFSSDSGWDSYPPSDALDEAAVNYCGAMRLCESMVGQDLMGFHPSSHFRADCTMNGTDKLYDNPSGSNLFPNATDNLRARRGYLQTENANAYRLWNLYGKGKTGSVLNENLFVLCDVYNRVKNQVTGKGIGMPILYYKADTSGVRHDPNVLPTPGNDQGQIYNYLDNAELVKLPPPWDVTNVHPLTVGRKFYEITKDNRITIKDGRPYRPDSYILISAGFDGMYGTDDDIFNFEK